MINKQLKEKKSKEYLEFTKHLGTELKNIRIERRLTQESVAKSVGLRQANRIYCLEGFLIEHCVNANLFLRILGALNTEATFLLKNESWQVVFNESKKNILSNSTLDWITLNIDFKAIREKANLTATQLAEKLGVSVMRIYLLENEKKEFSLPFFLDWLKECGINEVVISINN